MSVDNTNDGSDQEAVEATAPEATAPEAPTTEATTTEVANTEAPDGASVQAPPTSELRAKRLQWILMTMAGVAAAMLASLALPWQVVKVQGGTMKVGTEMMAIRGGEVSVPGRMTGSAGSVLVVCLLAGVCAFCAYKKWWMPGLAMIAMLVREGISVPDPTARGAATMAEAGMGLELVRVLWPAMLALMVLVTVQGFLVKQAENQEAEEAGTSQGLPIAGILARVLGNVVQEVRSAKAQTSTDSTGQSASK